MALSFTQKTIKISVTLREGSFAEGGNTRVIEGLACDATIQKPGLPEQNSASVKIMGLTYHAMEQMTFLSFRPLEYYRNTLTIEAGELGKALSLVFKGNITRASADFNTAPDPTMNIEASSGFFAQQIAQSPTAVKGEASAAQLMSAWAKEAGMSGFQNQGVTATVQNAYYPGDPISKMKKLAHDIGFDLIIDDEVVVILPDGKPRQESSAENLTGVPGSGVGGGGTAVLTKDTGLIGYPTFNQNGIVAKCFFNPAIRFGSRVKVESITPGATGEWFVKKLTHSISAYNPGGGPWETQIEGVKPWGLYA